MILRISIKNGVIEFLIKTKKARNNELKIGGGGEI